MKPRYHLLQEGLPIYQIGLGTPPLGSPSFLYFSVSAQSISYGQCLCPHLFTSLNLMLLVFQSPGLSMRPAYGVIRKWYELSRMTEKHSWGLVNITVWLCLNLWSLRIYFRVYHCNPIGTLLIKLVKYFHFAHQLWNRLPPSLNSPLSCRELCGCIQNLGQASECCVWTMNKTRAAENGGRGRIKKHWALS